ncbi:Hypothetical protein GbCGDNIH7_8027 [Granulibacter bethesdensis]|nr:Hypothetical protein GbCGDNIH7_8027 [Granulibacter bethesdensis]
MIRIDIPMGDGVYLRARGGTGGTREPRKKNLGLSPRTRRNPEPGDERPDWSGSISAHAEEPRHINPA